MRRSGDAAADFLMFGSCQCRLIILGVAVGLRGSSGAFITSMTGSSATGSRTYRNSLSALVNVSCETPLPMVVCSGEAPVFGGDVGGLIMTIAPMPIKQRPVNHTIAPRPNKQRPVNHTILITANPRMVRVCELIVSVGLNQALKGRPVRNLVTSWKSFAVELTRVLLP
jgi:hypothetical protein